MSNIKHYYSNGCIIPSDCENRLEALAAEGWNILDPSDVVGFDMRLHAADGSRPRAIGSIAPTAYYNTAWQ